MRWLLYPQYPLDEEVFKIREINIEGNEERFQQQLNLWKPLYQKVRCRNPLYIISNMNQPL